MTEQPSEGAWINDLESILMIFLSIVIPVYNGEECIERCLNSIWSQPLMEEDYEVICVNDCSTDNTLQVIRRLQQGHPNLHVYENAGNLRAGGSRNHGVREARGEYILFIDADDYFHAGALKQVIDYQKAHRLDILVCDFARHTLSRPNDDLVHKFKSQQVMTGREFLVENSLPYAPWKYVFRKALMVDNRIFFEEKVSCEDVDWSHKIALFAQTMQYRPILLTHYILTDTSQTSEEYKKANTVFHRLMAGRRVAGLLPLCRTAQERERIGAVAKNTLKNGIVFLNGLIISPSRKAEMIRSCVSREVDWGREMNWVRDHPFLYGCLSTMIAPFFRVAIKIKRKYIGR